MAPGRSRARDERSRERLTAAAAAMRGTLGAQRAAAVDVPHRAMAAAAHVRIGARVPAVDGHDEKSTVPPGRGQGSLTEVIRRLTWEDRGAHQASSTSKEMPGGAAAFTILRISCGGSGNSASGTMTFSVVPRRVTLSPHLPAGRVRR